MRETLLTSMRAMWTMRAEVVLDKGNDVTFLGLELRRTAGGIKLSQQKFIEAILEKHGLSDAKPLTTVQMDAVGELDPPQA